MSPEKEFTLPRQAGIPERPASEVQPEKGDGQRRRRRKPKEEKERVLGYLEVAKVSVLCGGVSEGEAGKTESLANAFLSVLPLHSLSYIFKEQKF